MCQEVSPPEQLLGSSMSRLSCTFLSEAHGTLPHTQRHRCDTPFGSQYRIPLPTHYLRHPSTVGSWWMRTFSLDPATHPWTYINWPHSATTCTSCWDIYTPSLFWVFVATHGLSLVSANGGYSLFAVWGLLIVGLLLLCIGLRVHGQLWHVGSVLWQHELSCPTECGIFLNQESNLCPLHWQVDS